MDFTHAIVLFERGNDVSLARKSPSHVPIIYDNWHVIPDIQHLFHRSIRVAQKPQVEASR
jgi:hypothetical protein